MIKKIGIYMVSETKSRIRFDFNGLPIFAIDTFLLENNHQIHRWVYSAHPPGFDYEIDRHRYKCRIVGVDEIEGY